MHKFFHLSKLLHVFNKLWPFIFLQTSEKHEWFLRWLSVLSRKLALLPQYGRFWALQNWEAKWNDNAAEQQQQVKKARPASENKKAPFSSSRRFNRSCKEARITKSAKRVVPHTTAWFTNWACCVFQDWVTQRNELCEEKFPLDLYSFNGNNL